MRDRTARIALASLLALTPATALACDKEDRQDVREAGEEVEQGVDNLDSDGKDD